MNRPRLITALLLAGVVLLGAGNAFSVFSGWSEIRPKLSHYKQRILEQSPALTEVTDHFAAHIEAIGFATETQKLDYVRNWVNRNSIHKIDEEHEQYARKTHVVVPMLWQHHLGAADPPHLACGSRSYAMKVILERLGIKSRVVDIFKHDIAGTAGHPVQSHTFLEVWNKDTHSWEIQDADLNLSYKHVLSAKRVSVFQMVMGNIDEMEPINSKGRGWYHLGLLGNKSFFKMAVYRLHYEGERSVAIINSGKLGRVSRLDSGDANAGVVAYLNRAYFEPVIFDGTGLARP